MPAGNLKKLKCAIHFGADAVYLGGKNFSLRAAADNFSNDEIAEGVAYAHARGKKVYVAVNIFARDNDMAEAAQYFEFLQSVGADAALISDLGLLALCREVAPKLKIHISTQANTLNSRAAKLFKELGASRIVLARELSLEEARAIHGALPDLELEMFCHGAMCVSYSGRCLLSSYLASRSANRGECAQPCRWNFKLIEERDGKERALYLEEDERGSYLLNSKDLRLLSRIPDIAAAGICSLKVEGRMKSEFYIATVASAYRKAIDEFSAYGRIPHVDELNAQLERASHRPFYEGFLSDDKGGISYDSTRTREKEIYVATVLSYADGVATVEMRNRFKTGDVLNVLSPSAENGAKFEVGEITLLSDGSVTDDAKLVQSVYSFACPIPLSEHDLLTRDR